MTKAKKTPVVKKTVTAKRKTTVKKKPVVKVVPVMTFGEAVEAAKKGYKITRKGWNGKGMWVIYVPGTKKAEIKANTPYAKALGKRKFVNILPHFDMYTANKEMLHGWLASQSDMDSTDWVIVK